MSIPPTILANLADVLAETYSHDADVRTMALTAGLKRSLLPFGPNALSSWVAILIEAEQQGCTGRLLERAGQQYPSHEKLAEAIADYTVWVTTGRPDISTGPATSARLPLEIALPSIFAGRSAEQQRLIEILLHMPEPASAAIQGFGGIGKTTLAQKVTYDVVASFQAGALWVSIGPGTGPGEHGALHTPLEIRQASILAHIASSLHLDLSHTPHLIDQALYVQRNLARRGRLLAVLDDLWDVDLGGWLMDKTLPPDRVVLVTSRDLELCKALCDHIQRLEPLTDESDALELLARYLDSPLGRYKSAALELATLLEGHPLALMLAARLCLEGPADLPAVLRRLRQKPTLGVLKLRGRESRNNSVEASFTLSYEGLDPDLQRRLRALGIFAPAPFALPAVAAVWGDNDVNTIDEAVSALTAAGFLQKVEPALSTTIPMDEAEPVYRQHSLLRAYALALLERAGEAESIRRRHLEYYEALPGQQAEQWQATDPYWPQVEQAWRYAKQQGPQVALRFYFDLKVYLERRARHPAHLDWTSTLLALPPEGLRPGDRAAVLDNTGWIHQVIGQPQQALDLLQQALQLQRSVGDLAGEGSTLNYMAIVYHEMGELMQALDFYEQALTVRRAVGERTGEAATLNSMGYLYDNLGQPKKALDFYAQALAIRRTLADQAGEGATLHNMGLVYRDLGQPQDAQKLFEQALSIMHTVGNYFGEATVLNNLASVYLLTGKPTQALELYQQALPLRRIVGDRSGEATTLNGMGRVYNAIGQPQQALVHYEQALAIRREVRDRAGEAAVLHNMAAVYRTQGQPRQALVLSEEALLILRAAGDRPGEATALNGLGLLYHAIGQPQQALAYYEQALSIQRAVENRDGEASTLSNMAGVYEGLGQSQRALEIYEQALPIRRAIGDRVGEAATLNGMGLAYYAMGQREQALALYGLALAIRREVIDRAGEAATLHNMAAAYRMAGQVEQALTIYQETLPIMREVGNRAGEAAVLNGIGMVYEATGRFQEALAFFQEALTIRRDIEDQPGEAGTLHNMGWVAHMLGQPKESLAHFEQALRLWRAVENRAGEAATLRRMALVYAEVGEQSAAIASLEAALGVLRSTGLVQDAAGECVAHFETALASFHRRTV